MSLRSAGPAAAFPIVLIMLLGGAMVFFIPLSPSLTVTFSIGHTAVYPAQPTITAITWSYSKVTLASSAGATKGQILLSSANSTTTSEALYTLTVAVSHSDQTLSGPTSFGPLGEGTYQVRAVYFPRQEQANIPYVVTIVVSQIGLPPVAVSVGILPT